MSDKLTREEALNKLNEYFISTTKTLNKLTELTNFPPCSGEQLLELIKERTETLKEIEDEQTRFTQGIRESREAIKRAEKR